ncbi:MAG: DUF4337 domain-containing protein [Acidobacteriota bacterium]|nr:DUF4337 domain-containing protein [Acidobacteriota bacterium]
MPEGPEIDTERLTDEIRLEAEREGEVEGEGGGLLRTIALTTALFAALAAVAALRAGATVNEALVLKTEATRLQAEASDQWAYYQAKGIKASVAEASRAAWLALAKEAPPEYAANEKRYRGEQEEIAKKAKEKENERDAKSTQADHLLHRHHGFANAVALFQVSIALGAVAALTKNRPVWFGSLLLGAAATVLFGLTLLG